MSAKLLHRRERILRGVLLRRGITLPLNESAAHGIVFLFKQHIVSGQELHGHRIRVLEVALGRVVNDVVQAHVNRFTAEFYREDLVGLVSQAV